MAAASRSSRKPSTAGTPRTPGAPRTQGAPGAASGGRAARSRAAAGRPSGPAPDSPQRTRERLLAVAAQVFAEHGFRDATVRSICSRAEANIAAVHYHFGDKQRLYAAVLKHLHARALERHPTTRPDGEQGSPAERLAHFVGALLARLFDEGEPAWLGRIMAREMIQPTAALDDLVQESIRPQCHLLSDIVRALLGPAADEERVRLGVMSIVGQCVFHHHNRAVITRLFPQQRYRPEDVARLAGHITQFSLAALGQERDGARKAHGAKRAHGASGRSGTRGTAAARSTRKARDP